MARVIECATVNAVIVFTQHPAILHDQEQSEDEEQMVRPKHDVPDPVDDVRAEELHRRLLGGDLDPGLRRPHDRGPGPAVEHLDAHEDVRDRGLQPGKFDALPGEPAPARRRSSAARGASRRAPGPSVPRRCGRRPGRFKRDGQAHAREDRRLPEQFVAPGAGLPDLEICRPRLVGEDGRCPEEEESREREAADAFVSLRRRVPDRRRVGALGRRHGDLLRHRDAEALGVVRCPAGVGDSLAMALLRTAVSPDRNSSPSRGG